MTPRRLALVAAAVALLTACGSTVQQASELSEAGPGVQGFDDRASSGPAGVPLQEGGTVPERSAPLGESDPAAPVDPAAGREDGSSPPPGRSQSSPAARSSAPLRPTAGPADRSPLKLGLLYVDNDAAGSAGVDNGNTLTPKRVLEALVASTNARGGLSGRRLVPTYAVVRSSSSDYATDLQAACASFTQDARVGLVLSFLGFESEQFSSCLTKAGVVQVNGSYGLGDDTSIAAERTTVSPVGVGTDRRVRSTVERLAGAGHLSRGDRIGVLVEGCPFNTRAVSRTLGPTARRLGLTLSSTRTTSCFGSVGDLGRLASEAQAAVLDFASRGVDRVLFVSAVEGNLLLFFATSAESQGYRPRYALSSLALPNVIAANVPQRQLVGAQGLGWLPSTDADGPLSPTPQTAACVALLKARGLAVVSRLDAYIAYSSCDTFSLTGRVLDEGGSASPDRFLPAVSALGTGFRGATTVDGATDFRSGRTDGAARGRVFAWTTSCSCFRYRGGAVPLVGAP